MALESGPSKPRSGDYTKRKALVALAEAVGVQEWKDWENLDGKEASKAQQQFLIAAAHCGRRFDVSLMQGHH